MPATRRGPATPLSRQRIVDAALTVIDRDGLEALSMRKLGAELGVEAMALYHHFPNKDALLDAVVDTVLTPAEAYDPALAWPDALRWGARSLRAAADAHPGVVPLVATRPPRAPGSLAWVEGPLATLRGAGLSESATADLLHSVLAYVFGWIVMSQGSRGERALPAGGVPPAAPVTEAMQPHMSDWNRGFAEGLDALLAAAALRLPPGAPGAAPVPAAPGGGSAWITQIEAGGKKKGRKKAKGGKSKKTKRS